MLLVIFGLPLLLFFGVSPQQPVRMDGSSQEQVKRLQNGLVFEFGIN